MSERTLTRDLVDIASELIRHRTVQGRPAAFNELASWIEHYLSDSGLNIKRVEIDGLPNLVITPASQPFPHIMLQGHVDVVDGAEAQFVPRLEADRLYGRGSADMKGFVAVALCLMRQLAKEGKAKNIGLMLTCDEETTGHGAEALAQMGYGQGILINGDGGYGDAVSFAEKGVLRLRFEAETKPPRRACPWEGQSAVEMLFEAHARLLKTYCPQQAMASAEDNWHTTFGLLGIESENEATHLPHRAVMSGRLFFTDAMTVQEYHRKICDLVGDLPVDVVLEPFSAERVYLAPDDPDLMAFRDLLQQHRGCPIDVRADNGTSDARFFVNPETKIMIFRMPGGTFHSPDEYIDVTAMAPIYQALEAWVLQRNSVTT